MDLLLILTYAAICSAIFKIFKIPLTKWTVPTAVLGGIFLIGALLLLMNYNHPFSENSRKYFITTPVIPVVKGIVTEVPVQANTPLTKGDVLFKIDPEPFEYQLASIEARLQKAQDDLARAEVLVEQGAARERSLDIQRADVDDLTAQRNLANYNLEHTIVRAPGDGYVTQITLNPGMLAVNLPFAPTMTFVNDDSQLLIGWYRQNSALRLKAGYEAEVAFDSIPGKVFSARVAHVQPLVAEGQVNPTSNLISSTQSRVPGRIAVLIEVTDPRFAEYDAALVGGSFAQTAVYSPYMTHVGIMRKILMRMASWMNYLFPFH